MILAEIRIAIFNPSATRENVPLGLWHECVARFLSPNLRVVALDDSNRDTQRVGLGDMEAFLHVRVDYARTSQHPGAQCQPLGGP